jgi:leader peptidase (prepilin peptidase) / N-methyltransferase
VNILSIEYGVVLAGLFVIGAVFGSLLNVCIYRLPREERFWKALRFLVYPPSHCPRCHERIAAYDNIPIVGWLLLRGRCRKCRGTISARYPLIELFTALLFAAVYWFEVPDWSWNAFAQSSAYHSAGPTGGDPLGWMSPVCLMHWRYALHMVLVIGLIVATFIDIDLRIIPDAVTLPAMAIGILGNWLLGQVYIAPLWYQTPPMVGAATLYGLFARDVLPPGALRDAFAAWAGWAGVPGWIAAHPHWHGLALSLAGVIVGGACIWAVRIVGHWALRREAMGFGDVVLMAMIGSFIGWQGTLIVFILALVSAVVVAVPLWLVWRDHELPYGPYLAFGTLLLLISAKTVWPWFDARIFAMGPMLIPMGLFMVTALAAMLFAWRGIQRRFGWGQSLMPLEEVAQWLPGDQLAYLAGENSDDRQGQWPRPEWPGCSAARGQLYSDAWRSATNPGTATWHTRGR